MQWRRLDSDVGNIGTIGCEAAAERFEIGQSSGIHFGVDGLGEFGFADPIVSQRQQPDHDAAGRLLALTGEQRLEGAPVGAAWEHLLAIDQIEQRHRLAAQGMDDMPVIDHMAVFAAGIRPTTAQRHQRRRAEKAVEPIIPRVRLRRPEDRLLAARAGDGRSAGRAPNRTLS
jgi:hypothetical protein